MLACLLGRVDSYLQRRQQLAQLEEQGGGRLKPLYELEDETYGLLHSQHSYPSLVLWQKGWGVVAVFDTSAIFTEDLDRYEFSKVFLNDLRRFVGN